MISQIIAYAIKDKDRYLTLIGQHLFLDIIALTVCILIAVPLGYMTARHKKLAAPMLALATLIMMTPTLAMFGLLQPLVGIGNTAALIALIIGGIPLILINTRSGYLNVDKSVIETASAMGMEPWRVCLKVETPLALPSIVNGIRIAAVTLIAGTAIATYIGAGGLGFYIDMGMTTRNFAVTYLGAITIAVIAITVDSVLSVVQKHQLKKIS